ncbi:MAG TPA: hypothetical protein VFS56_02375 [Gemmatimonadaceae bacterium]|nr:hypothetical protein [Gemmatimonadaceae bacterium]
MKILRCAAAAVSLFAAACALNERRTVETTTLAQLWESPADLEQRDLFYGTGGAKNAPDPDELYEFKEEKAVGTQPGYDVEDSKGREWSVKLGREAGPEVAVSRLVWAIGYRQPSVYYLPRWTLVRDGKRIPQPGARFRLDDTKNLDEWSWRQNPFLHTRQIAGLYVLMVMVNNWDVKSQQNALYEFKAKAEHAGPRQQYMVKDLGASLGRSAWPVGGSKADPAGFEQETFIERVEGNRVHFGHQGSWLEPQLLRSITPADVRWTSELLARLTPKQWSDAFRAAGFTEGEANRYIRRLQEKISEGRALGQY